MEENTPEEFTHQYCELKEALEGGGEKR